MLNLKWQKTQTRTIVRFYYFFFKFILNEAKVKNGVSVLWRGVVILVIYFENKKGGGGGRGGSVRAGDASTGAVSTMSLGFRNIFQFRFLIKFYHRHGCFGE